jgi:Mg2+-importing ATPase
LALILTSAGIVTFGAWLTISLLANKLGFVALPPLYWGLLAVMLLCYVAQTQIVKFWFFSRFGEKALKMDTAIQNKSMIF